MKELLFSAIVLFSVTQHDCTLGNCLCLVDGDAVVKSEDLRKCDKEEVISDKASVEGKVYGKRMGIE